MEDTMNYPLDLSFKLLALASQIYVRDSQGNLVFYVKQKMFKLKEAITVFGDEAQTQPHFTSTQTAYLIFPRAIISRRRMVHRLFNKEAGMKSLLESAL
jgi:hypothetical protein